MTNTLLFYFYQKKKMFGICTVSEVYRHYFINMLTL